MSAASLIAHESRQVDRFGLVVFRESLYFATMSLGPLLGEKSDMTMSRGTELPMRLLSRIKSKC